MKKFDELMKISNEITNISEEEAKEKLNKLKRSIYRC